MKKKKAKKSPMKKLISNETPMSDDNQEAAERVDQVMHTMLEFFDVNTISRSEAVSAMCTLLAHIMADYNDENKLKSLINGIVNATHQIIEHDCKLEFSMAKDPDIL